MIDRLLTIVAPHHCSGCGKRGHKLCASCRNDITNEPFGRCVVCLQASQGTHLCRSCRAGGVFDAVWCVGMREGALERLIDDFKFEQQRAASAPLAELLDNTLPVLPERAVLVPIPTIAPHRRQRGFDHTRLIAQRLAHRRSIPYSSLLGRERNTVQFGADKQTRLRQAEQAFCVRSELSPEVTYILIDDIYTTGATLRAAAKQLRASGAAHVWVVIIARQTLD